MRPKAVIVSLDSDTAELEALLDAFGHDVAAVVTQHRDTPEPATYVGSGKVEEVRRTLSNTNADLAVFNADLKAGQIAKLERELATETDGASVRVFDRVRLILEIFATRATTREGRLQVELARLRYEMPLVREYIHLAKKGEHPGFMAGGEYGVNQYYDQIRKRAVRIERELAKIERERAQRRKHRRRGGFRLVALAGYTNAGKSTLLKALTGREVTIENRLFSTLETRTGRVTEGESRILLTDTVGFIANLPPFLVDAFHATLEEIASADLVLFVSDASDPPEEFERKLKIGLSILSEFEHRPPCVLILNKVDLLATAHQRQLEEVVARHKEVFPVVHWTCAKRGRGIASIVASLRTTMPPLPPP